MAEQNKKKNYWERGRGGGPGGYKSQHTQNHMAPINDNFQFATRNPTEIILSLKSFKGVTVGSLEKKKERSTKT